MSGLRSVDTCAPGPRACVSIGAPNVQAACTRCAGGDRRRVRAPPRWAVAAESHCSTRRCVLPHPSEGDLRERRMIRRPPGPLVSTRSTWTNTCKCAERRSRCPSRRLQKCRRADHSRVAVGGIRVVELRASRRSRPGVHSLPASLQSHARSAGHRAGHESDDRRAIVRRGQVERRAPGQECHAADEADGGDRRRGQRAGPLR